MAKDTTSNQYYDYHYWDKGNWCWIIQQKNYNGNVVSQSSCSSSSSSSIATTSLLEQDKPH